MSLQKQTIEIPLAGGLETKADPKIVPPGSVLALENAEFGETGAITKRNGFTAMSKSTVGGSTLTKARTLHKHKDALIMCDGELLHLWEPSRAKWLSIGYHIDASAEVKELPLLHSTVASPSALPLAAQMCMANEMIVYTYRNIAGNIVAGAIDANTEAVLIAPTSLGAGVEKVRMAISGSMVVIVWQDSANNIDLSYIDTSTQPTAFTARANVVGSVATDGGIDIAAADAAGNFIMFYETTVGPAVQGQLLTATTNGSAVTIAEDPNARDIGVVVSAAGAIYVAWNNNATNRPRTAVLSAALAVTSAAADMSTTASTTQFCGVEETTDSIRWIYSGIATGSTRNCYTNTVSSTGTIGSESIVMGSAYVVSKPWVYNSITYAVIGIDTVDYLLAQSRYLLVTVGYIMVSAYLQGAAYPLTGGLCPVPTNVVAFSTGVYYVGHAFFTSSALLIDAYYPQPGYAAIDFSARSSSAALGDTIGFASGGMVAGLDGAAPASIHELNFFTYPPFSLSASNGSGSLALGTYQVIACYAWIDGAGELHIGPASPAESITLAGAEDTITALVWNLRTTGRGSATNWILLYMTDLAGSVFYEYKALANDRTATRQSVDLTTVTGLTDNRTLYTTGGLLENGAPPPLKSLIRVGDRLYGMAQDGVLNYTKAHIAGEGPSFAPEITVRQLSAESGEEFVLGEMDGRLIAIGQKSVQVLTGEGLDDTGTNNTLSQPQKIVVDEGAVVGSPVAITPAGIFYKSAKGICLLDRSLAVHFIGAPVEDYKDLTTVSAVVLPAKSQVVFGHSDGEALVYDYHVGRWSVFANHEQTDAIEHNGDYVLARADGSVWRKSDGFVDGDEQPISMTVKTPWIKLSGLQGFQRLYHASLLGEWRSDTTITVKVYYDYSQTAAETVTFAATSALHGYSPGDPMFMRHHLGKKCQAVMFEISDSPQGGTGEGVKLTSLALEVGGKFGVARQSQGKTV